MIYCIKGGEDMNENEMLKLILEKIINIENDVSGLKSDVSGLKDDVSILKLTSLKVEHELIPNVQHLLDNYVDIAKKVDVSNDLQEQYRELRFEVDLIKKRLETFTA